MVRRQGNGPAANSRRTILIVARQAATRAELARVLMAAGHAVELADRPARARDVIAATAIDLGLLVAETADEFEPELLRELTACRAGLLVAAQHPAALERLRPFGTGGVVTTIDPAGTSMFSSSRSEEAINSRICPAVGPYWNMAARICSGAVPCSAR